MLRRVGPAGAALGSLLVATGTASAHVDYVADGAREGVEPLAFFLETVLSVQNAVLLGGGALAVAVAAVGYLRLRPFARDVAAFRGAMDDYRDLVPWLLRISVGVPLVGAGFAGYFFSPAVAVDARLLQVGLGFLILFGLATRAAALAALAVYLVGVGLYPELLLAAEFPFALLAVALLGPGRPSADEVLERVASAEGTVYGRVDPVHDLADRVSGALEPHRRYLPVVLRAGLGLSFVYLGVVQKLLQPGEALAVVAKYDLTAVVPVDPGLWVVGAGLAEAAVGLALLAGLFTRATALVAFGLFTLTLFGLPDDPVLSHLSLFGMVSALLITGAGPLSVDAALERAGDPSPGAAGTATDSGA